MTNMSEEPDTGKSAEGQGDAQLDALMAAADEQMLAAIKRRLNLDAGFVDIFGGHSRKELSSRSAADSNPHQAAVLIEMRLIARTLAGYLTHLADRADDLAVDTERVHKQCWNLFAYVRTKEKYPGIRVVNNTEAALQQAVVDAGGLAIDLEAPCELASKLTATARIAEERRLMETGLELADILVRCYESAKGAWSTLNEARSLAAWLAACMKAVRPPEISVFEKHAGEIHNHSAQAILRQEGLAGDLKTAAHLNPSNYLESMEIDASGADLSDAYLPDIEILDRVIWTHETTWPVAMENEVRAHSLMIREDVYQVCSGGRTRPKSVDV